MKFADQLLDSYDSVFSAIVDDIAEKGYSIRPNVLASDIAPQLSERLQQISPSLFKPAGIGRESDQHRNRFVRTDDICWMKGDSDAERLWLKWCERLQTQLNRSLFLGLFSFESHFAHYAEGDFYKKHLDAFKGNTNRVLSVVLYLNPNWLPENGGELVLYDQQDSVITKLSPSFGTLVVFLSEDFPHEVLPAQRDRFSVAGWFRVNASSAGKVDPPR
ncbi:MAG: 2OG-Fe(II) oxygenase [Gammaproteobacteria bacterium]|nr:2OG-Fe(II) oxygenase [Gammaproteobacteria bacterium]